MMLRLSALLLVAVALLAGSANASSGCASCANVVSSLVRVSQENPRALATTMDTAGDSVCRHAGAFLQSACSGLVGLVGEDMLLAAVESEDHSAVCADVCSDETTEGDLLFVLDGSLKKDKEDNAEKKQVETEDNKKNVDSNLQDSNKEDEVKRLRDALSKSELETKAKIAAAVKEVTDKVDENTKKAVAEASAKAVEEAKEKWRHAWRSRQWPVNVKVPEVASKLACTAESEGRIAFRDQNFFGCKQHCVNVCEQCNCKQEETSVWDEEGKVYKRVKREVCEQCCSQKCAPEWLNFAKCARVCKQCDCKEDHGVKVCQQCCNEECAPSWNPDPI